MKQAAVGYGCVALSLMLHAAALCQSGGESAARPQPSFVPVVMAFSQPELPPPLPPPEREPEPKPQPRPLPKPASAPAPEPESEPAVAAPPPTVAEPALTGTALLAQGESSWAAAAGNGQARDGAIGSDATRAVAAAKAPLRAAPAPPATLPLARLSRKPMPPPLQQALERYYPPQARRQGKSGEAKVRALIEASGRVSHIQISFESEPGFGAACQRALQQSQWTGPLGPSGEPTATFITYRCKFRIDD